VDGGELVAAEIGRRPMANKRGIVSVLVALGMLFGYTEAQATSLQAQSNAPTATTEAQSTPASAQTPERARPISRMDLAVAVSDLPPGYEERSQSIGEMAGTPIEGRLLLNRTGGPGPLVLVSATARASGPVVMSDRDVALWAYEFSTGLTRGLDQALQLNDWTEMASPELGEHARLYSFHHRLQSGRGGGDGALVVFSRGDAVSWLAVFSLDGGAERDVLRLARLVDSRVVADQVAAPSTAAAPAAARPAARVLYRDDFSDASSGWPREALATTMNRIGYGDHEYVMTKLAGFTGTSVSFRNQPFDNFLWEIDAQLAPPTQGGYLFMTFRQNRETREGYTFFVYPDDGTYRFERAAMNTNVGLVDIRDLIGPTRSAAIRGGTAVNHLAVRAQGADITLLVNGQELARVHDEALAEGRLALGVGHDGVDQAEVHFTNLVMTSVN
jgi:hypothetical protein